MTFVYICDCEVIQNVVSNMCVHVTLKHSESWFNLAGNIYHKAIFENFDNYFLDFHSYIQMFLKKMYHPIVEALEV